MINYIVYILIISILIFIFLIALKAMKRGIEAKQNLNKNYILDKHKNKNIIKKKNKT
tara:strand:- start:523 stop:693 length:171 start_codon:yes stop_codon:yes gene_type:complete